MRLLSIFDVFRVFRHQLRGKRALLLGPLELVVLFTFVLFVDLPLSFLVQLLKFRPRLAAALEGVLAVVGPLLLGDPVKVELARPRWLPLSGWLHFLYPSLLGVWDEAVLVVSLLLGLLGLHLLLPYLEVSLGSQQLNWVDVHFLKSVLIDT